MAELAQLLEQEIPEGRQHLQESYNNLEKVAQYCTENYLTAANKKQALEETKNYTTHSLASVAYQINSLATNFLKLLDLQQNHMLEMESNVNYLAQTVNIHKEKVARREIGVLTTNRSSNRPLGVKNGIVFPEQAERPTKYLRKPIDYSLLDDIGHGVKVQEQGIIKTGSMSNQSQRTSRSSSVSSSASSRPPTDKPPTPPMSRIGPGGSVSRQNNPYRTPAPPIAPPSIPQYAPSPGQTRQSGYAPSDPQVSLPPMQMQIGTPPVGMAHPISQDAPPPSYPGMRGRVSHLVHQTSAATEILEGDNQETAAELPPPPPDSDNPLPPAMEEEDMLPPAPVDDTAGSPGFPPPPVGPMEQPEFSYQQAPPPPPEFIDTADDLDDQPLPIPEDDPYAATGPNLMEPNWIPQHYLEKVIAIYDYMADKPDELTFNENAVIYVTNKNDDGWWEGVLNGVTGLFPGNYVEPCM